MRRFQLPWPCRALNLPSRAAIALTLLASAVAPWFPTPAGAVTANGRLQVIQFDAGQGDCALLISPLGQVVLIDAGVSGNPTPANGVKIVAQLQALGVTHVDQYFTSHYHSDHIGVFGPIFGATGIATLDYGWDRGQSYTSAVYTTYVNTLGAKRRTLVKGQVILLDSLSAHPVTIRCVDLAGCGVSTTDENSLSVVLKVSYGEFDQVFGGDLPGTGGANDPETIAGPEVGPVEVYKVHHHGSATSTSANWLNATTPKVGVISVGTGNSYGHPTAAALTRLHAAGVKTYWTETGSGVAPLAGWDKVSNNQVIISATWEAGGVDTIRGTGFADTFTNSGTPGDVTLPVVTISAPSGGESWASGTSHAITWNATDNVGVTAVDLAFSTDGGVTYPNAIASGLANSGTYAWTVPATPSTAARVRVTARDAAGNAGTAASAANFAITTAGTTWTITASAGANGAITPGGAVVVAQGASQAFTVTPNSGYAVSSVLVDGVSVGAVSGYAFTNVSANHTISAAFVAIPTTWTLTASSGANGTISPNGAVLVSAGASQTFAMTPNAGYHIASVLADGVSVGAVARYTFSNVTANHAISVTYAAGNLAPYPMAAGNYLENFTDIANWTNNFAAGVGASRYGSVAVGGTGTIPNGTRTTSSTATFSSGVSGGVQRGTGNIVLLATGTADNSTAVAFDLLLDYSGATAGTLSFDWATVFNSTGNRKGSLRVYTSVNGTTFTELAGAGVLNITNNVAGSGTVASVALPATFTNSATARIRFYYCNGTGGTSGSRPKISIDNIAVTTGGVARPVLAAAQGAASEPAAAEAEASLSELRAGQEFALGVAPSPAVRTTHFSFTVSREADVRLEIFDITGRRVAAPYAGRVLPGTTSLRWETVGADGSRLRGGVYFARLEGAGRVAITRVVILDR
jgi:beta-lactamase superfamily II metal-dependent hydrolase